MGSAFSIGRIRRRTAEIALSVESMCTLLIFRCACSKPFCSAEQPGSCAEARAAANSKSGKAAITALQARQYRMAALNVRQDADQFLQLRIAVHYLACSTRLCQGLRSRRNGSLQKL